MTTDTNVCHQSPVEGNIITPKGVLSYTQYLIEEQQIEDKKTGKVRKTHQLSIMFPPSADLTLLKKQMAKVALDNVDGDKSRAMKLVEKRFLDPNDLPNGGKPAGERFEGWTLVRASTKFKPFFYHPNGQRVEDVQLATEAYSGRHARCTLNAYWSNNSENKGVFIGVQQIQLLDHDEVLGGGGGVPKDEFAAVEVSGTPPVSEGNNKASDEDVDSLFD